MKNLAKITATLIIAMVMVNALLAGASTSSATSLTVNINTATVAELTQLPGVGTSKAQAIVKYRGKRGFKKVEEIMRVKGIGRKSFKKLRPYLTVKGPSTTLSSTGSTP